MSIVCCRSQSAQHCWQICSTMRAPASPTTPTGGRSNPARVCPQRAQVTTSGMRAGVLHAAGACVLHLGEAEELQHADVHPANVELVPLVAELGRVRVGV